MAKRTNTKEPLEASSQPRPFRPVLRLTLVVLHLVCPLLFFTNLTRNPYYTQIALLNIGVAVCGLIWAAESWRTGEFKWPQWPFLFPLFLFFGAAFASTVWSWFSHAPLRSGIWNEGLRVWLFTLLNSFVVLFLPLFFTDPLEPKNTKISIWTDIFFAGLWALLWIGFHSMKDPDPSALIWDTYGGFLWGLALLYGLIRAKEGTVIHYFHFIFVAAFLAGLYALFQYAGRDLIWSSPIQPYGGRPVSTFGNPNFLSSHLMMVSPLAMAFAMESEKKQSAGYLLISIICAAAVLCTLTRSSYVGLFAAYLCMAALMALGGRPALVKWLTAAMVVAVIFIFLFPASPVSKIQSPLNRFIEAYQAFKTKTPYGSWDQRVLIWSAAWDMLLERPFLGKGWGTFELFYPFYQGKYLLHSVFPPFRTHANNAHNILMEFFAQVGVVGTGLAIAALVSLLVGGWKIFRTKQQGLSQTVTAALISGIVGMIADNFFGNVSIFFAVPAFLFWWNVGVLYQEVGLHSIRIKSLGKVWGRAGLLFFMGFCIFAGVYYFRRWKEEIYYFEGFKAVRAGNLPAAFKSLEKAYRWFPADVNNNYELGNAYAQQARESAQNNRPEEANRFDEKAANAYESALRANPGYDEIYFNLGIIRVHQGQNDKAIAHLETALFINPLLREAYGPLANLYAAKGDFDKALRLFEHGVQIFPENKDFWSNLGILKSQTGNTEGAIAAYKRALYLDPSFEQARLNLQILLSKGKP